MKKKENKTKIEKKVKKLKKSEKQIENKK